MNTYLVPHSPEEFPRQCPECDEPPFDREWQTLRHWVEKHLCTGRPPEWRLQPGQYWVRQVILRWSPILRGDVCFFVKNRLIVARGVLQEPFTAQRFADGGDVYGGYVIFDPNSLTVFPDPPSLTLLPDYVTRWPRFGPELASSSSRAALAALGLLP